MSKRKHKSRSDTRREVKSENRNNTNINNNASNNMNNRQTYNNGPFGINPNQLLSSMFGNIDMNQINSLLQSMNTQGFDFNNLNLGNLMGNINNMGNESNIRNNSNDNNQYSSNNENVNTIDDDLNFTTNESFAGKGERNDENIQMLRAIRSIVGGERGRFIDRVITMYNDGIFDE